MKQETIQIRDLSIGYKIGNKLVAENLNASVYSGELTCLLGVNGVGKSTLLRTLSGFQPLLEGEILLFDKDIETYTHKELSHIIGVVLTEKVEAQDMSVTELVNLGRTPYTGFWGKLNEEDERIVNQSIEAVNAKSLVNRPVQTLSDGERQKIMIAKALAQKTPVIFLDEPTAFLDYPSRVEILQLLLQLTRQNNKTIFLSTHDLELALQIADKVWLMDREKGLTIGTPDELTRNGSLENFFHSDGIYFDSQAGMFRINKQLY